MSSKIKIVCQNLGLFEGHFDHFQGQKTCFLNILKVGLELFRSCLGIIFGFKIATLRSIFCSESLHLTLSFGVL